MFALAFGSQIMHQQKVFLEAGRWLSHRTAFVLHTLEPVCPEEGQRSRGGGGTGGTVALSAQQRPGMADGSSCWEC